MWQTNLIKLYCAVCDNSSTIELEMQRQSNNFRPQFSDEECITVYLWGISQRRFEQKTIYEYTKNHLSEWFPKLPSYQAFFNRLNRLAPAFQALAEHWLSVIGVDLCEHMEYIVDSCPIILAKGSRSGCARVARELCEKSYNSSRDEWYYGLKLHAVVARRPGLLPLSLALMASGAAQHDLPAAKHILENHLPLKHGRLYADKAYINADWAQSLEKDHALTLLTLEVTDKFTTAMQHELTNFRKSKKTRKMYDVWENATGSTNPAEWSKKTGIPVLCIFIDDILNAQTIFEALNRTSYLPTEKDIDDAIEFLQSDKLDVLRNIEKCEKKFIEFFAGEYSYVITSADELRDQIRTVVGSNVYDWYAKVNSCKSKIRQFATERYQLKFCPQAKEKVRKLTAEEAQKYLDKLIDKDPLLGINILKG